VGTPLSKKWTTKFLEVRGVMEQIILKIIIIYALLVIETKPNKITKE